MPCDRPICTVSSVLADLSQDGIVQLIEFVFDHQSGTLHIDGKSSVDDVRARQAQMNKTRVFADILIYVGEKRDDVVLYLFFNLFDSLDIKLRLRLDVSKRFLWNGA